MQMGEMKIKDYNRYLDSGHFDIAKVNDECFMTHLDCRGKDGKDHSISAVKHRQKRKKKLSCKRKIARHQRRLGK